MDERPGTNAMKFESLRNQWLDETQLKSEREKILDVCKRFEIKIRDVCAKPEPTSPVKPKEGEDKWDDDAWKQWKESEWRGQPNSSWDDWSGPSNYEWPGDRLRSQLNTAVRWGSVSDALDVAKTYGKIKDKCNAPPYPVGNDETQLELWCF